MLTHLNKIFKIEIDSNRVFGLDILRAVAILFVVLGHGSSLLPEKLQRISNYFVFDGVSFFFVLSGFLIGGILIKLIDKNGFSFSVLKAFWIRRWFRTFPNYFLILIILCILQLLFSDEFRLRVIIRYLVFSQNIFSKHPIFFPEAWSIAIEEWFYLIFPLLILFTFNFIKSYQNSFICVAILIILSVTFFRLFRFQHIPIGVIFDWDSLFRKQVITRMDSLMFGVFGAYISYFHKSLWIKFKTKLMFIGFCLIIASKFLLPHFTSIDGIYSCVFSFTFFSVGTLFMLPFLSELKTCNGFMYKPITYISLISYSMYLINLSIVERWIIRNISYDEITDNVFIRMISNYTLYWILVIFLSILIYKYFETPMTSLRERFK